MDVPQAFISRHPFPGPASPSASSATSPPRGALDTIRAVDEIYINAIKAAGLYDKIWQAFAVFLPIKSVGVQGDPAHALARRGAPRHHLLRRHDGGLVSV